MKKILLILFIPLLSFSQNTNNLFSKKGEVYFSFDYKNKHQLNELSEIISETQQEEDVLAGLSDKMAKVIDDRLLASYKRIRGAAKNGRAH